MRRILVVATVCAMAAAVLVLRLAQIQIAESEVWAGEAVRLVRAGALDPYRRGTIYDARGRVLARDHATYRLELSYRDFRRLHPLGQVAHARSALLARAVPLTEAWRHFEVWGLELARLTPGDLAVFSRGGAFRSPTASVPPTSDPVRARRFQRASDVSFYTARLLGLARSERSRLRELVRSGRAAGDASLLELLAHWRGLGVDAVEVELRERMARSRTHLTLLAERLDAQREPLTELAAGRVPVEALVDDLEHVRSTVEELIASSLFREALGFSAGRIDPDTLDATIDLAWIARPLYWDEERLQRWTVEARSRWLSWRDHYAVPRLLVEFIARGALEPDHLLDLLATIYAEPPALEAALDRATSARPVPAVLGRLPELFSAPPASLDLERFGVVNGATRAQRWQALEPLVDRVDTTDALGLPDKHRNWAVGRLRRSLARPDGLSRHDLELLAEVLIPEWEREAQSALARGLGAAADAVEARGELAPNGRLAVPAEDRERALETLRDALRDYGDRTLLIEPRPAYEVVYLLERFREEYSGFRAVDARVRVRADTAAADLVGSVSAVGVEDIQRQRSEERRLADLRRRVRSPEEDLELSELIGAVLLRSESQGVSGIEGEWDEDLRGENGYREHRGLEDVYGRGRTSAVLRRRVDGVDIRLSIDAELQTAAEWMLENPEYDRDDPQVDRRWFDEPVGAVVLLDAEGRVVVSASVPNGNTEAAEDERADRSVRLDRTLRKPAFQPPGSVFKPFVAAWALDNLGIDPAEEVVCARAAGPAEYGGVRCWYPAGHGPVDLSTALKVSCNCYFAWLGEQFPSERSLRFMASSFGFGEPTGLRRGTSRSGLFEEYVPGLFSRGSVTRHEARLAGNGLAVVEATPMQVGRAMLALATGELEALTNVTHVDGVPREVAPPRPLGVSRESLELVRAALARVAGEVGGTAHTALGPETLGVEVVVKTGSADLVGRSDAAASAAIGPPKHTWVAGWLPPEEPVAVFVVFLDRAHATSSHTAVYVARQFLRLPEVRAWLTERGVHYRH